MKTETLEADAWMKDVAPSTALRQWFGHRPERWQEFRRRYEAQLNANTDAWLPILDASRRGTVTLLFSAHDVDHNGAVVLRDFLAEREQGRGRSRGSPSARPLHLPARSTDARSRTARKKDR